MASREAKSTWRKFSALYLSMHSWIDKLFLYLDILFLSACCVSMHIQFCERPTVSMKRIPRGLLSSLKNAVYRIEFMMCTHAVVLLLVTRACVGSRVETQ